MKHLQIVLVVERHLRVAFFSACLEVYGIGHLPSGVPFRPFKL